MVLTFRVERFEVLDSTQDEMTRRLKAGEDVHGLVVGAVRQTCGRGQRGRGWLSDEGGSYQTLAVRDPAPPSLRQTWMAPCLAVGLASAFAAAGVDVGVKWPNDLYRGGKKVGGVLSEYLLDHLLIGVGVNVGNPLPEGTAGLEGLVLEAVHGLVLRGLEEGIGLALSRRLLPERFAAYDVLKDRPVTVLVKGERLAGTARGVTEEGFLVLERPDGSRFEVRAGRLERFEPLE